MHFCQQLVFAPLRACRSLRTALIPTIFMLLLAALSARAQESDWRDQLGRFRIGVLASGPLDQQLFDLEPFRLSVEEALGVDVEIFPTRSLASLMMAQSEGKLEYAIVPASAYAGIWLMCECIEPLASPVAADGASAFRMIVITRKNGSVQRLGDLKGKFIMTLSEQAFTTDLFIHSALNNGGVDLKGGAASFGSFASTYEAVSRFAKGEGDALLGWVSLAADKDYASGRGTFRTLLDISKKKQNSFEVLWASDAIPHHVHVVKKGLVRPARDIMAKLLTRLKQDDPLAYEAIEPGFHGGLAPAKPEDYENIVNAMREISR